MITRNDYMNAINHAEQSAMCTHRAYYAQFVNERTIAHVVRWIGATRLLESKDQCHFNDISLNLWDRMVLTMPHNHLYAELGDSCSLGSLVCIAKEAARQYVERNTV